MSNLLQKLTFPQFWNINTFHRRHVANRLALLDSYREGKVSVEGHPVVLQLEVTNRCNMRCPMCPRNNMTRPHVDMDMDLFKKIIDESHPWAEIAILHLLGEPLLNPQLPDMIRYCAEHGVRTVLSTNVSVLTDKIGRGIVESGLDVMMISMDGDEPETYETLRKGGTFERTIANVEKFLEMKGGRSPQVIVQMIDMPETHNQLTAFKAHWEKVQNVIVAIKPFTSWQGDLDEIKKKGWNENLAALEMSRCDRLWMWLTVFADGSLATCCRDYDGTVKLPSLKDHSIQEAWNGPGMRTFRADHLKGRSHTSVCKGCDYNPIMHRSAAARMASCMFDHYTLFRMLYLLERQVA